VNRSLMVHFLREEDGQDFIEYVLLLAFVVLVSAAILYGMADDATRIWTDTASVVRGHV
jgi:Flp pilus assembly pilin Flp